MECELCSAIETDKYRIVLENEYAVAMVATNAPVEYHSIVMPRRHVEDVSDLALDENSEWFAMALELSKRINLIIRDLRPELSAIIALNGEHYRTQPHIHLQVFPSRGIKTLISIAENVEERPDIPISELERMASELKQVRARD
jgi:histidine triad (HIT) family protein